MVCAPLTIEKSHIYYYGQCKQSLFIGSPISHFCLFLLMSYKNGAHDFGFYHIVWANFETILCLVRAQAIGGGYSYPIRVLTIADESKECTRLVYLYCWHDG